MYVVAAPLSFLNVTGLVTESCGRAGRSPSHGGAAGHCPAAPGNCPGFSGAGSSDGFIPVPPPCAPGLRVQTAAPAWSPAKATLSIRPCQNPSSELQLGICSLSLAVISLMRGMSCHCIRGRLGRSKRWVRGAVGAVTTSVAVGMWFPSPGRQHLAFTWSCPQTLVCAGSLDPLCAEARLGVCRGWSS